MNRESGREQLPGKTVMDASVTTLNILLAAVARGDRAAFERLYRRTSARLYGICLGVLRRPDLAEEVVHELRPVAEAAWRLSFPRIPCARRIRGVASSAIPSRWHPS